MQDASYRNMKLLLLFAFSLLLHSGLSQTTKGETGSGTTPGPCVEVECPSDSTCGASGDCECDPGFVKEGEICIQVCVWKEVQVNNADVQKDVDCSDPSYEPGTANITVFFGGAHVGAYSSANVSCDEACNNKSRQIGAMKCEPGGIWSDPIWTNCSVKNQSSKDDLEDILISTSNATGITAGDVEEGIDAIENVLEEAGETLPVKDASNAMETINNLLQATDGTAKDKVKNNRKRMLVSIENIASTVVLVSPSTTSDYKLFLNIVSNIVLCVLGDVDDTTARAYQDENYYLSPTERSSNLADSGVKLTTTESSGSSYIRAKPTSADGRVSLQLYSETDSLFPDLSGNIVENVIFGISGEAVKEFTIKFKIDSNITVNVSNIFEQGGKTHRLRAMRLDENTTTWVEAGDNECYNYSADSNFAMVTCNVTGQYSMKTEEVAEPTTKPATKAPEPVDECLGCLSVGAIVGIVIGSLVGVALIVGIVVYCVKFKNKSVGPE